MATRMASAVAVYAQTPSMMWVSPAGPCLPGTWVRPHGLDFPDHFGLERINQATKPWRAQTTTESPMVLAGRAPKIVNRPSIAVDEAEQDEKTQGVDELVADHGPLLSKATTYFQHEND